MKNRKKQNRKYAVCVALALLLYLTLWIFRGNTVPELTEYKVESKRIPLSFDGFRIVQISDFHNTEFGNGNGKLIELISRAQPDIIVITGDMIDSRRTDMETALDFAENIRKLCPVYYVTGNHESRISIYEVFRAGLEDAGVAVLENSKVTLTQNTDSITLMGLNDPGFRSVKAEVDTETAVRTILDSLVQPSDGYTVLLSHRPELFDAYAGQGIDLVFSGHAHGGQIRLPFVGGLVAPNQGLFPKYDAGQFRSGNTEMLVSRGVGNSAFPIRINNPPEIVVAELKQMK